jgi:hypothetical protein
MLVLRYFQRSNALVHHLFLEDIRVNYFRDEKDDFLKSLKVRKMRSEGEVSAAYLLIPEEKLNEILKEDRVKESPNPIPELAE